MSSEPSSTIELADPVSDRLYGIVGWLLIGLSPMALWSAGVELSNGISVTSAFLSLVFLVFSLVFLTFGVFINLRLRRQLNHRHAVTRFGRIRTVDDRALRPEEDRSAVLRVVHEYLRGCSAATARSPLSPGFRCIRARTSTITTVWTVPLTNIRALARPASTARSRPRTEESVSKDY